MYSPRSKDHLSRVVFSARVLQFFVLIRWLHPCFIICILNYKKDIFFIAEGRNDNQSESNNPDIVRAAHAMQCCASSLPYLTTDNIVDSWLKTFGNQFPFFNGCFFPGFTHHIVTDVRWAPIVCCFVRGGQIF